MSKHPGRVFDVTIRTWNRRVANGELIHLTRMNRSRAHTLKWEGIPASLKQDVDAWHEACRRPDPFDPGRVSARQAINDRPARPHAPPLGYGGRHARRACGRAGRAACLDHTRAREESPDCCPAPRLDADRRTNPLIFRGLRGQISGSDSISMMVASDSTTRRISEHIQIGTSQKSGAGRPPDCRSGLRSPASGVHKPLTSSRTATDPILHADRGSMLSAPG